MAKKRNNIIFLIQSFEQPRILKIIIDKSKVYDNVFVYGFTRKIHAVENYRILDDCDNVSYRIVATLEDAKYWNRLGHYFNLLKLIYKRHGLGHKKMYVVGTDLRIVTSMVFNKYVEYVISDLAWLYYRGFQKKLIGGVDKLLAKNSDKVLMTSRGFYEAHYRKYVKEENLVLTENKLATYGRVYPIEDIKQDKISIAYVGAFRYDKIISNLLEVVTNNPRLSLNFYGDGFSEIVTKMKSHADQYDNISFNGAFKNPDDLQRIYSENNLNFVVYNNEYENERVAMPNKYYESGFFNIPIVCATKTYVGKRAVEQGLGWVCDIDKESIKTFFDNLKIQDLVERHKHIKTLDKQLFNY